MILDSQVASSTLSTIVQLVATISSISLPFVTFLLLYINRKEIKFKRNTTALRKKLILIITFSSLLSISASYFMLLPSIDFNFVILTWIPIVIFAFYSVYLLFKLKNHFKKLGEAMILYSVFIFLISLVLGIGICFAVITRMATLSQMEEIYFWNIIRFTRIYLTTVMIYFISIISYTLTYRMYVESN